nr:SCAN domain-containing protein 1-like [Pogona vitticeps]
MMEEEEDLGRAEEGKRREVGPRGDHAVQSESEGELRAEMALKPIKQEPEEEERQQRWEAQWQEFLKSLQAPYLGRKYPQPPPSRLGEGPTALQSPFQGTAQAAPWPGGECGIQNLPSWTKEAHKVWGISPDSSAAVKEELDEDDSIVSEVHRRRFRRFCYWEAEGPREVCRQLLQLCRQWLKPETRSKEQIVELITLEQFLRVLPAEVQSRV